MGTSYSLKCWSESNSANPQNLPTKVNTLLTEINQQMSTYIADSELSQFNASPAGGWFPVSPATAFVTKQAIDFHILTNGASDVTVGPLVKLWDFGPGRQPQGTDIQPPAEEVLSATKSQVGCQHLQARLDPPALKKDIDNLEVDLSSIAKGYAVDAVSDLLIEHGFENFMVEIGGEVRARGTRTDGQPWRIGVEAPDPLQRSIFKVVPLNDQALATSGDYRNFRELDGQKVCHIVDPRNGQPLPYRGWSVTLLTETCLEADALATALLVMGADQAYNWSVEHDVAALFLIRQETEVRERATPKFSAMLER